MWVSHSYWEINKARVHGQSGVSSMIYSRDTPFWSETLEMTGGFCGDDGDGGGDEVNDGDDDGGGGEDDDDDDNDDGQQGRSVTWVGHGERE